MASHGIRVDVELKLNGQMARVWQTDLEGALGPFNQISRGVDRN